MQRTGGNPEGATLLVYDPMHLEKAGVLALVGLRLTQNRTFPLTPTKTKKPPPFSRWRLRLDDIYSNSTR